MGEYSVVRAEPRGAWESMVKLFKTLLTWVMNEIRRKPSLIELQTFMSDAVRIANNRTLATVSNKPNDLVPLCPSSFLGKQLAPYRSVGTFHDRVDLRRDYLYNATLAQRFWESWSEGYLPTLQNVESREFLGKTYNQVNSS